MFKRLLRNQFLFTFVLAFLLFSSIFLLFSNYGLAQSTANSGTIYNNTSDFNGDQNTSTTINNTDTGGLSKAFNYLITIASVVIIILVIFRILQGAITKGTFDNIYDQEKGKKIIKNAGTALLIFIFTYAILTFINPDLTGWNFITGSNITGSNGNNAGACKANINYKTGSSVIEMLMLDEGNRTTVYKDTVGKATIGVGFNLERDKADKVISDLRAGGVSESDAKDLVTNKLNSKVKLTTAQIQSLLTNDLISHKQTAVSYAAKNTSNSKGVDFNSLPTNIQNVLIDMTFNMGSMDSFVKLKEALDKADYQNVAAEIVNSQYCGQVGDRCSRLANLAYSGYCASTQSNSLASSRINKNFPDPKTIYSKYSPYSCNTTIPDSDLKDIGNGYKLKTDAANSFLAMKQAAAKDGITLTPTSGYRTDAQQLREWTNSKCTISSCNGIVARPCSVSNGSGSNHSTGYAVDINDGCKRGSNVCDVNKNPVYAWMLKNGSKYGFNNALPKDLIHFSPNGY